MAVTNQLARRPRAEVLVGNSRVELRKLDDNSADSAVTDPPYDLTAGSRNGSPRINDPATPYGRTGIGGRGFMGQHWDASGIAFDPAFWTEVLRVLKPGAHLAAFGSPRTWHRMVCAIEDAGFEIRDQVLSMVYGSGFPKSLDVAKQLRRSRDPRAQFKEAAEKFLWVLGQAVPGAVEAMETEFGFSVTSIARLAAAGDPLGQDFRLMGAHWESACEILDVAGLAGEAPAVAEELAAFFEEAVQEPEALATWDGTPGELEALIERWSGWGTALKPSWEPIVVARKPLLGTVIGGLRTWGTGAVNVDACRVPVGDGQSDGGRWPANVVMVHHPGCRVAGDRSEDESDDAPLGALTVVGANGASGTQRRGRRGEASADWSCHSDCHVRALNGQAGDRPGCASPSSARSGSIFRPGQGDYQHQGPIYGDDGAVARFFTQVGWPTPSHDPLSAVDTPLRYVAKPSGAERNLFLADADGTPVRNSHPTVKPLELLRWLVRLFTPPGGVVLDPFLGSGTTAEAALIEGLDVIGCEKTLSYVPIIEARIRRAEAGLSPGTDRFDRARRADAARRKAEEAGQLGLFG